MGDWGLIPGLGRPPGGGHGNLLQCLCLENPHEQRSLGGYSPWVVPVAKTVRNNCGCIASPGVKTSIRPH